MTTEERLADVIVSGIKAATAPIVKRLEAAEAKIVALDTKHIAPVYEGVYEHDKTYRRGSLVTRNGGLWLAISETSSQPGSNPAAWRLVVKSGDAAKADAR